MKALRKEALSYIKTYRGIPYTWGGDDPTGFDCSGLLIEYCKSIGVIERGADYTAKGLALHLEKNYPVSALGDPGDLVFFWQMGTANIYHCGIVVAPGICLEASGGGRHVRGIADAIKHNAFIKNRPINNGKRQVWGYIDVFND